MSSDLESRVWRLNLAATPKIVLLRLAAVADPDGLNCFRSVQHLAGDCGLCKKSVQRALKDFVADRVVSIEEPSRGQGNLQHRRIHIERATELYGVRRQEGPKRAFCRTGTAASPPTSLHLL